MTMTKKEIKELKLENSRVNGFKSGAEYRSVVHFDSLLFAKLSN